MYRNVFLASDTTTDDYRFSSFRSLSIVCFQRQPIKKAPYIPTERHFTGYLQFTIYNFQNALSTAPRSSIQNPTAPSGALSHQSHSAGRFLLFASVEMTMWRPPRSQSRSRSPSRYVKIKTIITYVSGRKEEILWTNLHSPFSANTAASYHPVPTRAAYAISAYIS